MVALRLNGEWVEAESVEQASALVRADIDATGVGSSDWYGYGKAQGEVRSAGKTVARISYNGRIWPVEA